MTLITKLNSSLFPKKRAIILIYFLCFSPFSISAGIDLFKSDSDRNLRAIYLVSQDKAVRPEYVEAIRKALKEVQQWYASQLNGFTFQLHENDVEIVNADVDSKFFKNNPNGLNPISWGVLNCEKVAHRIKGAKFFDPSTIWIVYSDSPGWVGQGGSGFACMP